MKDFTETCSGNGKYENGACVCDKTYLGPQCQYKNDCEDDVDCHSGGGKCIAKPGATNYPKKQCYCTAGFLGVNCERTSDISTKDYKESDYTKGNSGKVDFFYKIDGSVLEGIIVGATESWLAIGEEHYIFEKNKKKYILTNYFFRQDGGRPILRTRASGTSPRMWWGRTSPPAACTPWTAWT